MTQHTGDAPAGVAYAENLADIFYDSPPVVEFRRKYTVTRTGGKQPFLSALLEAYQQFIASKSPANGNGHSNGNGKPKRPRIALLEFRQPTRKSEFELFQASLNYSGIISAAKGWRSRFSRRSSSNIAAASCAAAALKSTWFTGALACRNFWCASI
jgi:hypothetical protein